MSATRTINPLHFEDLEPHRFEDLIRQLIYDFREWTNLEATGRAGSDDGFDVRGRERLAGAPPDEERDLDDKDELPETASERLWLIQCKREGTIGPKKLEEYARDAISKQFESPIYGVVFVARCDFSKAARDRFIAVVREHQIAEWQLWGKGELEDLLFQPKNDHLLFAYFGVSLVHRRRTQITNLRARIATKKKAHKAFSAGYRTALLRDVNDTHYPYDGAVADFKRRPPWLVVGVIGFVPEGLEVEVSNRYAYVNDDRTQYDNIRVDNSLAGFAFEDLWNQVDYELRGRIGDAWSSIPDRNRFTLSVRGCLRFEDILLIDEEGDMAFEHPHIYVEMWKYSNESPFDGFFVDFVNASNPREKLFIESDQRVAFFPAEFRGPAD